MKNPGIVALLMVLFLSSAYSQETINIRGRILDDNSNPVQGIIVRLKNGGLADTTGEDGDYRITNISSATENRKESSAIKPQMSGGALFFSLDIKSDVAIAVFSITGRSVSSYTYYSVPVGNYRMFPLDGRNDRLSPGIYLVRFTAGDETACFRVNSLHRSNHRGAGLLRSEEGRFANPGILGKTAQHPDTLILEKDAQVICGKGLSSLQDSLPDLLIIQRNISGRLYEQQGIDVGTIEAVVVWNGFPQEKRVVLQYDADNRSYSGLVYFLHSEEDHDYSTYIRVYDTDAVFTGRSTTVMFHPADGDIEIPQFFPGRPPEIFAMKDTVVNLAITDSVVIAVQAQAADENCPVSKYLWNIGAQQWTDSTDVPSVTIRAATAGETTVIWAVKDCDGLMSPADTFTIYFVADIPVWERNNNLYSCSFAGLSVRINSNGGRIESFSASGAEQLYPFGEMSGSTFWTSPQSVWEWPPPTALDTDAYTAELTNNNTRLRMESAVDPITGFRVNKEFYFDVADTALEIVYTIINPSAQTRAVAPWEVTRVPKGGTAFFPKGSDFTGNSTLNAIQENSIVWFRPTSENDNDKKMFRDGAERWIAYVRNRVLFLKIYEEDIPVSLFAPGESEIEIYNSENYIELEMQGRYTSLQPGASLSWTVKWYTASVSPDIDDQYGSDGLVSLARDIAGVVE